MLASDRIINEAVLKKAVDGKDIKENLLVEHQVRFTADGKGSKAH